MVLLHRLPRKWNRFKFVPQVISSRFVSLPSRLVFTVVCMPSYRFLVGVGILGCSSVPTHRRCYGKVSAGRQPDALPNSLATIHPIPSPLTLAWDRHWGFQWLANVLPLCISINFCEITWVASALGFFYSFLSNVASIHLFLLLPRRFTRNSESTRS